MAEYSWLKRPNESEPAYSAFRAYLEAGPGRSAAETCRKLKKSKSLVDGWSRTHDWRDRVRDFDNHVALADTDGLVHQVSEMRDKNIALMDKLRGLLDLRLDDFVTKRDDPTVRWTQALMAMAKIEANSLLLGDRAAMSKTTEQVAKVEEMMAELDDRIRGRSA